MSFFAFSTTSPVIMTGDRPLWPSNGSILSDIVATPLEFSLYGIAPQLIAVMVIE
jgi:hypothetical protein